jgi:nitroreductase
MPAIEPFDAIHTLPAARGFTEEPVSDQALRPVLDLAVRALNSGHRQPWQFVAIRRPGGSTASAGDRAAPAQPSPLTAPPPPECLAPPP